MSERDNNNNTDSNDLSGGILTGASDLLTDLVTGSSIPAPIRKNVFKAFGQLCSAAINIPVAYLEGIATEKRAETQARVKLINASGDQIASQMNVDPKFAYAAAKRYSQKIVREQVNLDKICEIAAQQIHQNVIESALLPNETTEISTINQDWLNNFEKEASQKSTKEMQFLFGKILAEEIQQPSSFSIKTVKLLAQLDSTAAIVFRQLCALSVSLKAGTTFIDARVISIGGDAGSNSLENYGLGFNQLNILHEAGLIIPNYNSYCDYQVCIWQGTNPFMTFSYQNRKYGLYPSSERVNSYEFRLSGVMLSRAGLELLSIIDIEYSCNYIIEKYTTALFEYFLCQDLKMCEIN